MTTKSRNADRWTESVEGRSQAPPMTFCTAKGGKTGVSIVESEAETATAPGDDIHDMPCQLR